MGVITNLYSNDVSWQSIAAKPPILADSDVHVWRINIPGNIKYLAKFEALLTADEILRAGRYKQQKDTYRFIVSRGTQRIILGQYLNLPPAGLQFVLGDHKKPYVLSDDGNMIHYNISHAGDWIVLAIARVPVGADVEFIDESFPFSDILADNFSKAEERYIRQQDSTERFFTLWTRKEAILKATGQGLGDHLPITPALNGDHILDASLTGSTQNWQLISFELSSKYLSTIVAEGGRPSYHFFNFKEATLH